MIFRASLPSCALCVHTYELENDAPKWENPTYDFLSFIFANHSRKKRVYFLDTIECLLDFLFRR